MNSIIQLLGYPHDYGNPHMGILYGFPGLPGATSAEALPSHGAAPSDGCELLQRQRLRQPRPRPASGRRAEAPVGTGCGWDFSHENG